MSKKKHKFDLAAMVHLGLLQEGQWLYFVSDPAQKAQLVKQAHHEFKLQVNKECVTLHAFVQNALGTEPPDHATKWVRTEQGQIVFDLWRAAAAEDEENAGKRAA